MSGQICLLKLVLHIEQRNFKEIIMKLSDLAEMTESVIERGAPDIEINSAAGLDIAAEGEITFLANPKYTPQIEATKASALFLNESVAITRKDIAVLRGKRRVCGVYTGFTGIFPYAGTRSGDSSDRRDRSDRNGRRTC